MLGGETSVAFTNPIGSLPHIKAGRLRMIAVTTAQRWPLLPELPTIAESGVPGYEIMIWNGLAAPAATPQPVLARLHRELTRILAMAEVNDLLAADGSRTHIESPRAFAAFIKAEIEKWIRVIAQARLSAA